MLRSWLLLGLSSLTSCLAIQSSDKPKLFGVSTNATAVNGMTFDYIVVGGGLTGITVASRLSENPNVTVLLVEVGEDKRNDSGVADLLAGGGGNLNWRWPTDQKRTMGGGKVLGGGSSINAGLFTRGTKEQYDSWSMFLEPSEAKVGWDWTGLYSYMKKGEKFGPPTEKQVSEGAGYNDTYHGYDGPLSISFPEPMYSGPQLVAFSKTAQNLTGMDALGDLNGGNPNTATVIPMTVEANSTRRCSAANAYITPFENRTNWLTLTKHMVTNLTWANTSAAYTITASGIQFAPANGNSTRYVAKATREVILAGGAIQTPALLQLSGIGDSRLLKSLNITVRLDMKSVGRNLQEQTQNGVSASGKNYQPGNRAPNNAMAFPNMYQLLGNTSEAMAEKIRTSIPTWAKAQANESGYSVEALEAQFKKQADLIIDDKAPTAELYYVNGFGNAHTVAVWNLLPFSRGNVQIKSTDPFVYPNVTVNYFAADVDLDLQIAACRMVRKMFSTLPLSNLTGQETGPGSAVPDDPEERGSDEAWKKWALAGFTANNHPLGTVPMMRRELGGAVDAYLKVYNTTNLRVVDASIMPMQLSGHMMATLYGIAEKAADLIKESWDSSS